MNKNLRGELYHEKIGSLMVILHDAPFCTKIWFSLHSSLSRNTADGKTVATVAVMLRVDATGIEVEGASVVCRVRRTRPVVAVRADITQ